MLLRSSDHALEFLGSWSAILPNSLLCINLQQGRIVPSGLTAAPAQGYAHTVLDIVKNLCADHYIFHS